MVGLACCGILAGLETVGDGSEKVGADVGFGETVCPQPDNKNPAITSHDKNNFR